MAPHNFNFDNLVVFRYILIYPPIRFGLNSIKWVSISRGNVEQFSFIHT